MSARQVHPLANLPIRVGIILLTTAIYAASAGLRGAMYVVRGSTPTLLVTSFWYMLAAFPVFGMLLADLAACWGTYRFRFPTLELGGMLGLLVVLSTARLGLAIPLSGHALLFAYVSLRRALVGQPPNRLRWIELAVAAVLYLATTYLKVFCWSDPLTAAVGTAVGLVLAVVSWSVLRWRDSSHGTICSTPRKRL